MVNKIIYCLVIWIMLVIVPSIAFAQGKDNCKGLVVKHFNQMQDVGVPGENSAHRYIYSTHNKLFPEYGSNTKKMKLDYVVGKGLTIYESSYVSMYKDQQEGYLVVHPQKKILIFSSKENSRTQEDLKIVSSFQDSVFVFMTEKECKVIKENNIVIKRGVFTPSLAMNRKIGLTKIVADIEPESGKVLKIENFFEKPSKYQWQEMVYHEVDLKYKGKLPKNARDKVFSTSNALLAKYQNYEIIDQRKK